MCIKEKLQANLKNSCKNNSIKHKQTESSNIQNDNFTTTMLNRFKTKTNVNSPLQCMKGRKNIIRWSC